MESLETTNNKNKITLAEKTAVIWRNKYDLIKVNSFSECFPSEENKTLKMMFRENLDKPAKYLLYDVVLRFAASFNLTNNFREDQIQDFVNDIFEFYPHLTIRDVKFFLQQVKAGNFGQIYNRLDGPLLFGYLKVYNDLRLGEAERHESKLGKTTFDNQSDGLELLKILAPNFRTLPAPPSPPKKVLEPNETYLKIHKDFVKLHASQGSESGTMFVNYKGKMMNFEEYYNTIIDETFE